VEGFLANDSTIAATLDIRSGSIPAKQRSHLWIHETEQQQVEAALLIIHNKLKLFYIIRMTDYVK
jgi:hypothetical protein